MNKFFLHSKTILFGLAVAVGPAALTYIGSIDWSSFGVSPAAGLVIGAAIVALRSVTSIPVTMQKGS